MFLPKIAMILLLIQDHRARGLLANSRSSTENAEDVSAGGKAELVQRYVTKSAVNVSLLPSKSRSGDIQVGALA